MTTVAILDDFFPHELSAFRFTEFCAYLDHFPGVAVHSNGNALPYVDRRPSAVGQLIAEHVARHPRHAERIHAWTTPTLPDANAYYTIFLNNISSSIEQIDQAGKPFAFTLYPGGGLNLDDPVCEAKLRRVCASPNLHSVIVTQANVRRYLLTNRFLPESRITFIPGVVVPPESFEAVPRSYFGQGKEMFDVGFIALKYTARGEDKGYDLFVSAAQALHAAGVRATYHVVGPWSPDTIALGPVAGDFRFHGFLMTEQLTRQCRALDVILSPNRQDILAKGAFDGFPTGCCIAAGLQGAVMICTDPLKLSGDYVDDTQMMLVQPDKDEIIASLMRLYNNPALIGKFGRNGQQALQARFGYASQIEPRLAVMKCLAGNSGGRA